MDYSVARHLMVESQIRTNRIVDPLVIAAMSELPRERFVPESLRGVAYIDEDVPLGRGRFLIEPLVTALLLQTAAIQPHDVVLEIGCGCGYTAALLARFAGAVVALESDAMLAEQATAVLAELGATTAEVVCGPLRNGYPKQAPYDVILFGGSVADVPGAILDQLGEGGRLVAVIAAEKAIGRGTVMLKSGGSISSRVVFDAAVPLLPEFVPQPTFRF